jgi:hypothetical protein
MKRPSTRAEPDQELGLNRIVYFSDAVMAIAITLLAVNIRVPQIPAPASASQLGFSLVDEKLDPRFIRGTFPLAVATPLIFLASIPVAFVQPGLAPLVWWLVPLVGLGWRLARRRRR